MLESTRNRPSVGRLTKTAGPAIGGLAMFLTLGNTGITPPSKDVPLQVFDMQAGPIEDMERYLDCLLKKLMGIPCDEEEPNPNPPNPSDPVGHLA